MKKISITILLLLLLSTTYYAQEKQIIVPLWENGAPGFEDRKDEPELAKDYWVKNIHNPNLIVMLPPKDKANGTAVLVCPGGGFRELVVDAEGIAAGKYFNSIGVATFVLKYRLPGEENSPYKMDNVKEDAYRAMRLIRYNADKFGIKNDKIGIMGFSAGGVVVNLIAYDSGKGDSNSKDPIDSENGKPNFQILVYPGPTFVPTELPDDAPPAFMIAAIDDEYGCAQPVIDILQLYMNKKLPAEAHIYAKGKHAFNMGQRTELETIKTWPERLEPWMIDNGLIIKK